MTGMGALRSNSTRFSAAFHLANAAKLCALFAISALVVFGSIALTTEAGRIAAIWPLNAIIVAVLVRSRSLNALAVLATAACANLIVAIAMGDPLELALPLAIANVVEIAICWRILNGVGPFNITRVAHLVRFVLVAGVGAPMAAAVIAGVAFLGRAPFLESSISWFAADALGLLIFAPALLAIDMRAIGLLAHRRQAIEAALNFVLLTGVCVLVFGQGEYPLLFLVPPTVALTTFRSGINGAALSIIWVSILAITFHLLGTGPAQSVDAGGYTGVYLLQAFLALLSVTTLPLATYLAENQRHQESLRLAHAGTEAARRAALSSEAHYRMLAEHSTDIVVRLVPGGIISYASPACRVLGFSPEQAVGRSTLDLSLIHI